MSASLLFLVRLRASFEGQPSAAFANKLSEKGNYPSKDARVLRDLLHRSDSPAGSVAANFDGAASQRLCASVRMWCSRTFQDHPWCTARSAYHSQDPLSSRRLRSTVMPPGKLLNKLLHKLLARLSRSDTEHVEEIRTRETLHPRKSARRSSATRR